MNGNAVAADSSVWHCEHGHRCISRSLPDLVGEPDRVVTHFDDRRLNSPNDVAIAADGTIWFTNSIFGIAMPSQGTLATPELDYRSVYRFSPDTAVLTRIADFDQPNGVALSRDGGVLYVSDTSVSLGEVPGYEAGSRHEVERFERRADGGWGGRRRFVVTDHGYPDGFAVNRRGWLWCSAGTVSTSGQLRGSGWATSRSRKRCRTWRSAARTGAGCSSRRRRGCWQST